MAENTCTEENLTQQSGITGSEMGDGRGIFFCKPCEERGNNILANGYCMDCNKYLCESCHSNHRTSEQSQNHVIQCFTGRTEQASSQRSHDTENNTELLKFEENLESLEEKCARNKEKASSQMQQANKCYDVAMDKFKRKLDEIKDKDVKKIKVVMETCDTAMKEINMFKSEKERFEREQKEDTLDHMKTNLETTENKLTLVANDSNVMSYEFLDEEDDDENRATEIDVLGRLVRRRPYLIKIVNVKHSSETFCSLRGIALLRGDLMLVTDSQNYSIKLININSNSMPSYTQLNSFPWELTVTDSRQVYIAQFANYRLLHLRNPTVDVRDNRVVPVDGYCMGVEYHNQKFKIQCYNPCKLFETDVDGKLVRTINSDISRAKTEEGKQFIKHPFHSCLNQKNGAMIVSCSNKHSISEITADGNVKLLTMSEKLKEPRGLVMDTDSSLLVCSSGAQKVFRVTEKGEVKKYLDIWFKPWALALDRNTRRLYVGGEDHRVLVYQM